MDQEQEAKQTSIEKQEIEAAMIYGRANGYLTFLEGSQEMHLTVKGKVHVSVLGISNLMEQADKERRDFTEQEKQETRQIVHTLLHILTENPIDLIRKPEVGEEQ